MRAYRDGYTRQAVRLRLDAAYSGQEDLKLGRRGAEVRPRSGAVVHH